MIVTQPLHTFKDGDTFIAAGIENGTLVLGATRNEEAAAEGKFPQLITVMNLTDAIALAKALLASQAQEMVDEDAKYDAWVEAQYQRHLDHQALVDSALEHDIVFA